jgi:Uma2 family endonuclease
MEMFARCEMPEFWIVDPDDRRIEIHALRTAAYDLVQLARGSDQVRSAALPDPAFVAGSIFPEE